MSDNRLVQVSWEVGATTFSTYTLLRSLTSAAGVDNVHPQAVFAAEALGAGLIISPKRITEAIDALGGNDSMRLASVKATIGLSSGGIRRYVRQIGFCAHRSALQSTALLKIFALCAAFKLCYVDEEIGDILHNLITQADLLAKVPVSSTQLRALVSQLSDHAECTVPVDLFHDVAVAVGELGADSDMYRRLGLEALAPLFVQLFDCYRDDSVREIHLTGHDHGVWLASALVWLLEDDASICLNDEFVFGNAEGKVTVTITSQEQVAWTLHVWRKANEPQKYVFNDRRDGLYSLSRLPMSSLRSHFEASYWSQCDTETRDKASTVTGTLATALVSFFMEHQAHATQMARALSESLEKQLYSEGSLAAVARSFQETCDYLAGDIVQDTAQITESALYVAYDAVVTATCKFQDCSRYITTAYRGDVGEMHKDLASLLLGGMPLDRFRVLALQQVLAGAHESIHPGDILIARQGIVAGMAILWDTRADPQRALELRICRGAIRIDEVSYECIREAPHNSFGAPTTHKPLRIVRHGDGGGSLSISSPESLPWYRFEPIIAIAGNILELKHYMVLSSAQASVAQGTKGSASWTAAANAMATAHYVSPLGMTSGVYQTLIQSIERHLLALPIHWSLPLGFPRINEGSKFVVNTGEVEKLRVFAAGNCDNDSGRHCCSLVIRRRGTLAQCIAAAQATGVTWVLVM
ncbi:MAG: hypothetical protein M1828_001256 [Chrysothrix sp. TS-e1954]|nr:MAG: hypothetical protein M1828_001256 [Chrysothrix sp. TS-e1954]